MTSDVLGLKKPSKIRGSGFTKGNVLGVIPRVRSYAQAQRPE